MHNLHEKIILYISIIGLMLGLLACSSGQYTNSVSQNNEEIPQEDTILVGFSQLGAESDWRSANTISMKDTFAADPRYKLIFEDGQQKQANQITAIRKFIQQDVDYIVLAPVTEEGWDTVLEEAKEAGIPVILVDRMISVEDDSLYTCFVGSDFALEGQKLTTWLYEYTKTKGIESDTINIVNIQGSLGSTAQIGRTESLREAVKEYGWNLLEERSGEFTETKGKEVMASLLQKYDNINVVYCENDNEAYGAIMAIEAAGKKVGSRIDRGEIMVLAFDGVSDEAIEYVKEGKITCIAECNPLHGPRVHSIITTLNVGGQPEKISYVKEGIITADNTISMIKIDGESYDITILE